MKYYYFIDIDLPYTTNSFMKLLATVFHWQKWIQLFRINIQFCFHLCLYSFLTDVKLFLPRKQSMMVCKISRASLSRHKLKTVTVPRIHQCLALCSADERCLSVNYQISIGECTLNDDTDQGNHWDFQTNQTADYVHYTSKESCGWFILTLCLPATSTRFQADFVDIFNHPCIKYMAAAKYTVALVLLSDMCLTRFPLHFIM